MATKRQAKEKVQQEDKDPWKINEFLRSNNNIMQESLSYNPYYERGTPFILTMEFTNKLIYVLLKNGKIIKFGGEPPQGSNFSKIEEIYQIIGTPIPIKIPTKIIDISCGFDHSLARGRDCKIFSWGTNSHGQLGLENCHIGSFTEKPDFIPKLNQYRIVQIYATHYNSFCVADDNTIFGFGNNDHEQIKINGDSKISIPEKMDSIEAKVKQFKIFLNKKGKNLYYSELNLPTKAIEKTLEMGGGRTKEVEEAKLKAEIRKLKEQLGQFRIKVTIEDYQNLIQDIQKLIIKYEEKGNKILKKKNEPQEQLKPIKNFEKQIEFIHNKKTKSHEDSLNSYFESLDERVLPINSFDKDKEDINTTKETVALFSEHVPQLSTLLERVSAELQIQKFRCLESYGKAVEQQKNASKKNRENNDYIHLFKQVIDKINKKIESLHDTDTFEESENIKIKCAGEYQNLKQNTLNEITVANLDVQISERPTLNDFTKKSSFNLQKLSEKMTNLQIESRANKLGKSILDSFNHNIILTHQNNYLASYMINVLVTPAYQNILEKAIYLNNPKDFRDIKAAIDGLKKAHDEKEDIFKGGNNSTLISNNRSQRERVTYECMNQSELKSDDEYN